MNVLPWIDEGTTTSFFRIHFGLKRRLGRIRARQIMGAAYYIVLEKEIDGLDTTMDGKFLSRLIEPLDRIAAELGVRPLSEFVSMDGESLANVLGDDAAGIEVPPVEQFSAEEGLATIRALLPRQEGQQALHDLRDCERILSTAAQHGVGWHFQIDT
jgi:hypothetical protein